MSQTHLDRAAERIRSLSAEANDVVTYWRAASEIIARAVPHYLSPCWFTLDPASLLITSHFSEGVPTFPPEALAHEYYVDDVNKLDDVARSRRGISTLHEATGGDPRSSPRWHANMELGADQEVIAALRTASGDVWGAIGLYREPGERTFSAQELGFIRSIATPLAEGARQALLLGEATDPDRPEAPGLLVLSETWEVESITPGLDDWLRDLPDGDWDAGRLPSSVMAVAGQTRRAAARPDEAAGAAVARVLSRSGRWIVLHGAALLAGTSRRVAVIVERADPVRIAPLLMSAYGLTDREQEITRLVLRGGSTNGIAEELVISPYTVQEHLKKIFAKTGVRSRRDLVGRVFFAYYEPRLRDNEDRALRDRPLRGGPMTEASNLN